MEFSLSNSPWCKLFAEEGSLEFTMAFLFKLRVIANQRGAESGNELFLGGLVLG